jgi:hypothetical protein
MFEWMFDYAKRFRMYLRSTFLEANAGFKVLGSILREEERRRGVMLHLRPFAAMGDKDARIRSTLQPEFEKKQVYCVEAFHQLVNEEVRAFPQSRKKDIIDALQIAIANRIRPWNEQELLAKRRAKERFRRRTSNVCGY